VESGIVEEWEESGREGRARREDEACVSCGRRSERGSAAITLDFPAWARRRDVSLSRSPADAPSPRAHPGRRRLRSSAGILQVNS
jgi:hypothetical protein